MSFDLISEQPSLPSEETLNTDNLLSLSLTQRRIIFIIATMEAEDINKNGIVAIRRHQIQRKLEESFGTSDDNLTKSLQSLHDKGYINIVRQCVTPNDPLYFSTIMGLKKLGLEASHYPHKTQLPELKQQLSS